VAICTIRSVPTLIICTLLGQDIKHGAMNVELSYMVLIIGTLQRPVEVKAMRCKKRGMLVLYCRNPKVCSPGDNTWFAGVQLVLSFGPLPLAGAYIEPHCVDQDWHY